MQKESDRRALRDTRYVRRTNVFWNIDHRNPLVTAAPSGESFVFFCDDDYCNMITCTCRDKTPLPVHCMSCGDIIGFPAVRIPHERNGWTGWFCSWDCAVENAPGKSKGLARSHARREHFMIMMS
jgi:hypothetical protein